MPLEQEAAHVALSSGEAELSTAAKGLSERGRGHERTEGDVWRIYIVLKVGASACNGMLLRAGTRGVKRLSTRQLWVQGAIHSYGLEVQKVPRTNTASDVLTCQVGESELKLGFRRMQFLTREEERNHSPPPSVYRANRSG